MEGELLVLINNWLEATIRLAAPIMIVSFGAVFTERSGVYNIGVEGIMLVGALAAVVGAYYTGNIWVATLCAVLVGLILGLVHAYLTVTRKTDHIISGAAINLLALGLTNLLSQQIFMNDRPRVILYPRLLPPEVIQIPIIGPFLLSQPVIVWIAILLAPIMSYILFRTSFGLNIRAVGENPDAVATCGLSVVKLKYAGILISGFFAGLGGAALALAELGYFVPNMTSGRGFMALAALVVGRWNPLLVALACLLFGGADALQLRIQTYNIPIPYQFLNMLPYLLTIIALAGLIGRTHPPKTLGNSYDPAK